MKFFKLTIFLVAVLVLTVPAWSGNVPEFDTVGNDRANVFASFNSIQYGQVIRFNVGPRGPLNLYSDFTGLAYELGPYELNEGFETTAGQLFPDPCFGTFSFDFGIPYLSALSDTWNEALYEWRIVLQMKPESDINLNIYDCVLKHNSFNIWAGAEQTGRYRLPWGQLVFAPAQNPEVRVLAWPGDYSTPGFNSPFVMDARTLPGLEIVPMDYQLYTSKALWSEGIVLVMPETGVTGESGDNFYSLKQGDIIQVQIYVNPNPADVFYGPSNVILKYIGIYGTWYYDGINDPPPP